MTTINYLNERRNSTIATYPINQIITEYGNATMDVEMTTGHALQHIQLLYQELRTANQQQQALQDQLIKAETRLATLQTKTQHQKLRAKITTLQNNMDAIQAKLTYLSEQQVRFNQAETKDLAQLTALSLTVYQVKAALDSLKHQLGFEEDVADSAKN